MDSRQDSRVWQFKWHIVLIIATLAAVVLLALFTNVFEKSDAVRDLVWLMGALIFLGALLTMLSRVSRIAQAMKDNNKQLADATKALGDIHVGLAQIRRSTQISESAKAIAFRDQDRQSLREAVFDKLERKDFEGAYELIDEIEHHTEYGDLAHDLRHQADRFHDATDQERVEQAIAQIETLFETGKWGTASVQIEELIRMYPDSHKAKGMRQHLLERKENRKRLLLAQWDDAVNRKDTDRSLTILKELDMYLTPNEALALQEAAKDAFRTKLHNLGVQFALAVSDKQWTRALEIGQQIISDFPNSKMSGEIRAKLDVLEQNVQLQGS